MSRHDVQAMLEADAEGSSIPLPVYELMATVIHFASELNEMRADPQEEEPPAEPA